MNSYLSWDELFLGYEIPAIEKNPTATQLFMFSAITWNRHLIHYNQEYACNDGLKNVVVHRALLGNYLAEMLTTWLGQQGRIKKIEWSVRSSAFPGDMLICTGRIISKYIVDNLHYIKCDTLIKNQDGIDIAPGTAEIIFLS